MTYFYREEPAAIPYHVKVTPGPTADEAKASLHKQSPTGGVAKVEQLSRQGEGTLNVDFSSFQLEDSPIFIEFLFKSKKQEKKAVRAIALADARPAKIAPGVTKAKAGDKVKLEVSEWSALVYDQPGKASESVEPDPKRIPSSLKSKVKWKLDEQDLPDTGEKITVTVKPEHEGKVLNVEAYIEKPTGKAVAKIDCFVLEVQLHDALYEPCGNVKYTLTLSDGSKLEGTSDGSGWVKKPIPFAKQRIKIEFTPKGETEPHELWIAVTDAGDDQDDFYLCHLENMGYLSQGEPPEAGIVRFQAARGKPLTLSGKLDDATKSAIKDLLKKEDEKSLKKGLFED